jgi:hypothetical protein
MRGSQGGLQARPTTRLSITGRAAFQAAASHNAPHSSHSHRPRLWANIKFAPTPAPRCIRPPVGRAAFQAAAPWSWRASSPPYAFYTIG